MLSFEIQGDGTCYKKNGGQQNTWWRYSPWIVMGFKQYDIFSRAQDKLFLSSFLPLVVFLVFCWVFFVGFFFQVIGVAYMSEMIFVSMGFYPEDFRFNIYVLWPFRQRTERFSEDKYKTEAYMIVFSLRAFCCIIYDGQVSPEVSELPCMRVMVDLRVIWRTTKRILKLEHICKTSLDKYFALAVGFLSIIFSDNTS